MAMLMRMFLLKSKLMTANKAFFLLGFILFYLFASAGTIAIESNASREIEAQLVVISNPITQQEKIISKSALSKSKPVKWDFQVNETNHFYLYCDDSVKEIYFDNTSQLKLFYDYNNKSITWLDKTNEGLNKEIEQLNESVNNFITRYFKGFAGRLPQAETKKFIEQLNNQFSNTGITYFKIYLHYRKAYLERISGIRNFRSLADEYLNKAPFLYAHPAYLDFLNIMTEAYFELLLAGKHGNDVRTSIYEQKSYSNLYQIMMRDTTWSNEPIRHVILLNGLKQLCYNKEFDKAEVVMMIQSAAEKIKLAPLDEWAKALYKQSSKFIKGNPAPNATFTNADGKQINIKQLKGKPLYISYFPKAGVYAQTELTKLKSLNSRLQSKIIFITIIDGLPLDRLDNFVRRGNYDWMIGITGKNDNFKEVYEAGDFQAFYLIDARGNTFQIPAEAPSTDVEMQFPALLKIKP
jgi:hypothetical protein